MQRIFTLFIFAMLIYSVLIYREGDDAEGQDVVTNLKKIGSDVKSLGDDILLPNKDIDEFEEALEGNIIEKSLSKVAVNILKTEEGQRFFSKLITPQNNIIPSTDDYSIQIQETKLIEELLSLRTIRRGKGGEVCCGHMVEIYYTLSKNGEKILENKESRVLGSKSDIPIVDSVVAGMKVGEVREAIIPKEFTHTMGENIPKQSMTLRVSLEKVLSKPLIKAADIRIFDDTISYKLPYLCGDSVQFSAKITDITTGEVIYGGKASDSIVTMKIGEGGYPLIFAYALFNKAPMGTRTIIVQGKYFDGLLGAENNKFLNTPLKHNMLYLLELSDLTRLGSQAILMPKSD